MSSTKHYGHFNGTKLVAPSFAADVKGYEADTPLEFTVRKCVRPKTTPQNNYLHFLFQEAAKYMNEAGYGDGVPWTKDRVKQLCKREGLYPMLDLVLPGGIVTQVAMDTRDLDKDDARETIDRVIPYFAEMGIILPLPGEQQNMELE